MYIVNVNDNFGELLDQFHHINIQKDPDLRAIQLRLDFQNERFVAPTVLTVLVAFVEKLKLKHDVFVDCINLHQENVDYISRMNFFREVGFDYEENFARRDGTGRFIPLTRLTEGNRFSIPGQISRIIKEQWDGIDDSITASLDWSITEIIDNVFNHAQSPINGFVVAQHYPFKKRIDLLVLDGGMGIPKRLKSRDIYRHLSSKEALDLAVDFKVTVDPVSNVGAGLYYTRRIIEENGGILRINSGNAQLLVSKRGKEVTDCSRWLGTIVQMRIRTDVTINPKNVWGNVPTSFDAIVNDGEFW